MHLHEQARGGADGGNVVVPVGAIRGSDLDQGRARAGEDVGDAELAADLDQLAAGDDRFAPARQRGECEQQRSGCVVHHEGVLRTRQLDEEVPAQPVT